MNYKLLGKSGLRVSEISLGTMTIGNAWGWGSEKEESLKILKKYTDEGGNFIDTACNYQDTLSEQIIGEYVRGDRDRYVIASKYTLHDHRFPEDPNAGGNHRKNLLRTVRDSLERLQTDYLDILYLHMWDGTTGITEIMRTLNDLVSSSKINYIAISDSPAWVAASANTLAEIRGWEQFTSFQFPYSVISRDPENEIMPFCRQTDLAMTTWNTLCAGLLTGKYSNSEGKGRLSEGKWGRPSDERLKLAEEVATFAAELGITSAQVAIRWVMQQPGVVIPIIGATKPSQLEDTLASADVHIPDKKLEELAQITGFNLNFPQSMINSENVKNLVHGKTYTKISDHRNSPYF